MVKHVRRALYQARLVAAAGAGAASLLPVRIEPLIVSIRLSDRCNARCLTCGCWAAQGGPGLDRSIAIRVMRELKPLRIRAIRFSGGEPLLRQDLFHILAAGEDADLSRVIVATNGLLLHRLSGSMNDSIITNLTVSLDGMRETNDRLRGVPGYFDRVMEGLRVIRKQRVKVVSTLTAPLVNDMEDLIRLCRDAGYDYDVNLPNTTHLFDADHVRAALRELWPSASDVERMADILEKHGILSSPLLDYMRGYMKGQEHGTRHCMHGYILVGIEPDGTVNPGCYLMPSGDLHDASLSDILGSRAYRESVRRMYHFECPRCTCGYALSVVYEKPLANLGYIRRRLKSRR